MKKTLLVSLLVVLVAAACSGAANAPTPIPLPTTIPAYNYVSPTPITVIVTAVATDTAVTAEAGDTAAVTAGLSRYTALNCGSCHGDKGQGNGDKGPTLIGMTLSEDDFISFLRSGGKLGSKHQYASNRLSDTGAHNLYQYVKSLSS